MIHDATEFDFYRLNFRQFTNTPEQIEILRDVLQKQLESPFVIAMIQDPARRAQLRAAFDAKLQATIPHFYP